MKKYWESLQPRERRIVLFGAAALAVLLGYVSVWEPYVQGVARLRQEVSDQRAVLAWMEDAAAEVRRLRKARPAGGRAQGQSLLTLVDATAKRHGLGAGLKRVQPDGQNTVRVWLEQASFDGLLRWLDELSSTYGVKVTGMVVERRDSPGVVDSRVVLEAGS